jgi:hypothetical protein
VFFTVNLAHRGSRLLIEEVGLLREAYRAARLEASVLIGPDSQRADRLARPFQDHRVNFLCFMRLGSMASAPRRRFLSSS